MYDQLFLEDDFPAGFKILKIESAGHFMHIDAPQAVNDALVGWLTQRATESPSLTRALLSLLSALLAVPSVPL